MNIKTLLAASSVMFINSVNAALIETIIVPVNGSAITSTTTLNSGTSYLIEASGTFAAGGPGDGLADAEYFDFSNPPDSLGDHSGSTDIGISINGADPDWGPYSPTHVYQIIVSGNDQPLSFSYNDVNYSDNFGSLTVTISAVPIPAAVWLFGSGLLGLIGVARHKKAA